MTCVILYLNTFASMPILGRCTTASAAETGASYLRISVSGELHHFKERTSKQ